MAHDPDRLVWPPRVSHLVAVLCVVVLGYAAVEREWIIVGLALVLTLVAVLTPRMIGPFEFGGPGFRFKGEVVDPHATGDPAEQGYLLSRPSQLENDPPTQEPPPGPPRSTGSPGA